MDVIYPARMLPVLKSPDVAVAGGSLAGIAAAHELARAGKSVLVVEPRTYLGREITATLRPWLVLGRFPLNPFMEELIQAAGVVVPGQGEIGLKMDHLKLFLEDTLLAAGVEILYASQPVQVLAKGGQASGMVIGNKSGRQVISTRVLIDATETALLARLAGVPLEPVPGTEQRFRRTLAYAASAPGTREIGIPESLGLAGKQVSLHGGVDEIPLMVEMELAFPPEQPGFEAAMRYEIDARMKSMALALYLREYIGGFGETNLGAASFELHGHKTTRLAGDLPGWAVAFAGDEVSILQVGQSSLSLPVRAFAAPLGGLWCLSDAARFPEEQRELFLDPLTSAWVGAGLGQALAGRWPQAAAAGEPLAIESAETGGLEVHEPDGPQRGRDYARVQVPSSRAPVLRAGEVLVDGGGTSGLPAALAAAREGVRTTLVEMNPGLGGTGTLGGVPEYWFGRRVGFVPEILQAVTEWDRKLGFTAPDAWHQWSMEGKMHALLELVLQARVEVFFYTLTIGTIVEGERVRGILAATPYGPYAFLAEVTIDATGDGDVAAFADAEFTYGAARDHSILWTAMVQEQQPGLSIGGNFTSMCDVSNVVDMTRMILSGRRRRPQVHDHSIYLAPRESRHILGDIVLTFNDMLLRRRWPDVVNIFYSNYDLKGKSTTDWNLAGLVSANLEVELPYRALIPRGLDGLLVAGKAFSASSDAIPLARMQPDLENLGGVAGLAAALSVSHGCTPRQLPVMELQRRLVEIGLLPTEVLTRRLIPRRLSPAAMREWVSRLDGDPPLYEINNMPAEMIYRGHIPFVEVCTAGPEIVSLLASGLETASSDRQVRLAQALAMCGDPTGVPVLMDKIREWIGPQGLPERTAYIMNAVVHLPDHAAMPDPVYLLYSLGMARDRRSLPVYAEVTRRLADFTMEDFCHPTRGPFYYVDAICYGLERLGDPQAIPILAQLHRHPLLHGQALVRGFQADYMLERLAMLELAIARALARCGSLEGYAILIDYLEDVRSLLAEGAHSELADITGVDFGKNAPDWRNWLDEHAGDLQPKPWTLPTDAVRVWGQEILVDVFEEGRLT